MLAEATQARGARLTTPAGGLWETWGVLLLIAAVLYVLIGPSPYSHESTLDPETGAAVMSPVNRYIWFALLGLAAPLLWRRRWALPQLTARAWPLLALLCWFALSTRWALDPATSQRRFILLVCQTAICAGCCLELRNPNGIHRALAWCCALMVGIDLLSWIALPRLSQTEIGLAGIHNHKNSLGLAMLFCVAVCTPYVFTQKTWAGRGLWTGVVLGAMALLVASLSKTSLGITLAALALAPLLLAVLASSRGVLVSVLACAAVLLAAMVFGWLGWCSVTGRDPLAPFLSLTFTDRTDVWRFVVDQWSQRPWGGVGYASFWDIDPKVQPSLQTDLWFAQPESPTNEAHDGYLDLLVATGGIGLAMVLIVLLRWMTLGLGLLRRALREATPQARAARPYLTFLGLFPVLVALHNLLESSYFNTVGLFSFMVLLMGLDVDLRTRRASTGRTPRGYEPPARTPLSAGARRAAGT